MYVHSRVSVGRSDRGKRLPGSDGMKSPKALLGTFWAEMKEVRETIPYILTLLKMQKRVQI